MARKSPSNMKGRCPMRNDDRNDYQQDDWNRSQRGRGGNRQQDEFDEQRFSNEGGEMWRSQGDGWSGRGEDWRERERSGGRFGQSRDQQYGGQQYRGQQYGGHY